MIWGISWMSLDRLVLLRTFLRLQRKLYKLESNVELIKGLLKNYLRINMDSGIIWVLKLNYLDYYLR